MMTSGLCVGNAWIRIACRCSYVAAATATSLQLCPTLCDPIDGSRPGSPVPGILQARTLEWVAISFSNAWKWKVKGKSLSRVQLFETPWTAAHQAPPSIGFSRQEYWSGVPSPSPNMLSRLVIMKKEFTGPVLHLRPLHADHARPPFQWTLNSVFSAYENNHRRIRYPSRQGNHEDHI